jgi:DNA-binding NtrC family response regulator
MDAKGAHIRDLGSRNGTAIDGVVAEKALLRDGSTIALGRSSIRFELGTRNNWVPASDRTEFGSLIGRSLPMRIAMGYLELAAQSEATVLLEGETGTGKEGAAQAIHDASPRRGGPFVVVDCGAIPSELLESELFGHERGAFTGAATRRVGAFEEASGGTVFLDEIGELPVDLQPKLLRVLEQRQFRRVGSNTYQPTDVRVLAATNRDLRAEVNESRFREDLYFRVAVVKIRLPPLRERPEDIPFLTEHILRQLRADADVVAALTHPEFLATLKAVAWRGNVRELRNYLEQCVVFRSPPATDGGAQERETTVGIDPTMPYRDSRRIFTELWERRYVEALVAYHDGNVAAAARAAGMDRTNLYRLLRKHALQPSHSGD